MQISGRQMLLFNEKLNDALIRRVERFLRHQHPGETAAFGAAALYKRCSAFVQQCLELGAADQAAVLSLAEIAFKLSPSMSLSDMDPKLQDCLVDMRFSFEERVDIVTLRLAFPS